MSTRTVRFQVGDTERHVTGLLVRPDDATMLYVLGHGAGAGMRHPFMEAVATLLAKHSIATLRYQFPYMEVGRRRPDPPHVLEDTVRSAVATAARETPDLPRLAGGKSMGGRIASMVAAKEPRIDVNGLVFLGYPLHAANKPSTQRARHLERIRVPMLFLQGTRDSLADLELLRPIVQDLDHATMHVVEDGDHSFKVRKRSGRTEAEVLAELAETIVAWAKGL